MNAEEGIDAIIDVINKRGWCQGGFRNTQGNVCIMGAAFVIGQTNSSDALAAIQDQINKECQDYPYTTIPMYNDAVAKSVEDVVLMLKKAKEGING